MNKITSTIFTTIILINLAMAGGKGTAYNRRQNNNTRQQVDHLTRYEVPASYIDCEDKFFDIAKKALAAASGKNALKSDTYDSQLSNASCGYMHNSYDWARVTYLKDNNSQCTVYVVVSWVPWVKTNKDGYVLNKEHTQRANQEMAHCVSLEDNSSKVHTDDQDMNEEVEEQTTEIDVVDVDERDEQPQAVDESTQTSQIDTTANQHNHQEEEQSVDDELSNEDNNKEDNKDVEAENGQFFGPGHFRLPLVPQKGAQNPEGRNDLSLEEDDEEEESNTQNHSVVRAHEPLVGGWTPCSPSDSMAVPQVFAMLIAQNKLTGIVVYSQNVEHCEKHLVNGLNYNVVVSFNDSKCQIAYHREFSGEVSLLTSARKYPGVEECTEKYRPNK